MKQPVLFLIFNSTETSIKVFQQIKDYKPSEIFISADGGRDEIEHKSCEDLRELILSQIDWDCKIHKNFYSMNQGCQKAVSGGINWFFQNVNSGIILEDDCLPINGFFDFCEAMLEHYKDDDCVMHITGTAMSQMSDNPNEYFFSISPNIWGWATWRRAWEKYQINLNDINPASFKIKLKDFGFNDHMISHILYRLRFTKKHPHYTWDYKWSIVNYLNLGLTIHPAKNLILNIGFDQNATNTFKMPTYYNTLTSSDGFQFIEKKEAKMNWKYFNDIAPDIYKKGTWNFLKKELWCLSPKLMKYLLRKFS